MESKLHRGILALGGIDYKLAPTTKGLPDRLVILPGNLIFLVELKAKGGRLSPAQIAIHAKLAKRGTHVVVLTGPDEVDAWLKEPK